MARGLNDDADRFIARHRYLLLGGGAPFDPANVSVISSFARVDLATVTGLGVSLLPDTKNAASPWIQAVDSRRPPRSTESNGVQVLAAVDDVLQIPTTAARNDTVEWGFFCHIAVDDLTVQHYLLRVGPGTANNPVAADSHYINPTSAEGVTFVAAVDATGANTRRANTPSGVLSQDYVFLTVECRMNLLTELLQVTITTDAYVQPLTFDVALGAAAAMPAALQGSPGDMSFLNRRTNASSFPTKARVANPGFIKGVEPGATEGQLTSATRLAMAAYNRPVSAVKQTLWIAHGNSLVAGTGSTNLTLNSYPAKAQGLLTASQAAHPGEVWVVTKEGFPGFTTPQLIANFAAEVAVHFRRFRRVVISLLEIGNHIVVDGATDQEAIDAVLEYAALVRALGAEFALHTCLPRSGNPGAFDAVNAYFRANPQHYDILIDHADNANLLDPSDTTYFDADGTHLNDAGYVELAEVAHDTLA